MEKGANLWITFNLISTPCIFFFLKDKQDSIRKGSKVYRPYEKRLKRRSHPYTKLRTKNCFYHFWQAHSMRFCFLNVPNLKSVSPISFWKNPKSIYFLRMYFFSLSKSMFNNLHLLSLFLNVFCMKTLSLLCWKK